MLEISEHILAEAKELVQNNPDSLPMQITSAPLFYVAKQDDGSIQAFDILRVNHVTYKIGAKKE